MNGYSCTAGPLTREGEEEAVACANRGKCPRCRGPLRDLRGTGFNTRAIEREGTCFWWAEDAYTCVTALREVRR